MVAEEVSFVLESGYGCFAVFGAERAASDELDGRLLDWLKAPEEDESILVVKAGAQFGPYGVTVQIRDEAPPDTDATGWEDVAELSVACAAGLALGDLEDGPGEEIPVGKGTYRLRISAAGRTESAAREREFPDEDEPQEGHAPLERYLLQLWLAPPAAGRVLHETSQFAAELASPPVPDYPVEREAGLQAARLVAEDLRRIGKGGGLSGQLGELMVRMELHGTPTRVFNRLKLANGWPPGNGGMFSSNEAVGDRGTYYGDPPDSDGLAPLLGVVTTRVLAIDKPTRIVRAWNWRVAGPDGRPFPANPRLLESDSIVEMTFAKANARGEDPRTSVMIRHSGVPAEWLAAQEALWEWSVANFARL